jgi:hypothetical protein
LAFHLIEGLVVHVEKLCGTVQELSLPSGDHHGVNATPKAKPEFILMFSSPFN